MDPIKLPSGTELKITPGDFESSRDLFQAVLEEGKGLKLDPMAEIDVNLFKDLFCVGFSSKKIEKSLWKCMEKCLYNEMKIQKDTFEPLDARQDYMTVCIEVGKANIMPFMKSLSAQYSGIFDQIMKKDPA